MTMHFLSHLGIQVPKGWLPSEVMAATRADGRAGVHVQCMPTGAVGAEDLAARHGEAMAGELADYAVESLDAVVTAAGERALLRRAETGPSEARVAHAVLYSISGPWAYVAHVWAPRDQAEAIIDLLRGVTPTGLEPVRTPAVTTREPSPVTPGPAGEAFTVEELVAVAEANGASSLLGYDRRVFRGMTRANVGPILRVAARSLLARQVLQWTTDGRLAVAGAHDATLGVALRHDEWVQALVHEGATTRHASWAVRGADGVALTGAIGTSFRLEPFSASELVDRVEEFAGLDAGASPAGEPAIVPTGALDAAIQGDDSAAAPVRAVMGGASRAVRVRHLVRAGSGVRGGDEMWLIGPDSARRVVRPTAGASSEVVLEPAGPGAVARLLTGRGLTGDSVSASETNDDDRMVTR
jgi:hypothetical protein